MGGVEFASAEAEITTSAEDIEVGTSSLELPDLTITDPLEAFLQKHGHKMTEDHDGNPIPYNEAVYTCPALPKLIRAFGDGALAMTATRRFVEEVQEEKVEETVKQDAAKAKEASDNKSVAKGADSEQAAPSPPKDHAQPAEQLVANQGGTTGEVEIEITAPRKVTPVLAPDIQKPNQAIDIVDTPRAAKETPEILTVPVTEIPTEEIPAGEAVEAAKSPEPTAGIILIAKEVPIKKISFEYVVLSQPEEVSVKESTHARQAVEVPTVELMETEGAGPEAGVQVFEVAEKLDEVVEETTLNEIINTPPPEEPLESLYREIFDTPKPVYELSAPVNEAKQAVDGIAEFIESADAEETEEIYQLLDRVVMKAEEIMGTEDAPEEMLEIAEEDMKELFIELFDRAEIEYTPELVESFVKLALMGNISEVIPPMDTEDDREELQGRGTHEVIKQLLTALASVKKAALHAYHIGRSTLRLYSQQLTAA